MTDLIRRLRDLHMQCDGLSLYAEAADELERLRAALRNLLDMDVAYMRGPKVEEAVEASLAALKEKLNERN